ncbi:PTPLA-domain-containing protein [Terfezia boudieri ATCC MYA-4762]|uniref:Very-long-chain (3R)-3-hydroxyacyl-CoA dehydratase n=1 Tax=Terfezia boudieri ATCC MYA-4762 TaxID=1051890 RepID=A0A3N4M401_9PEZI|nr:PTPLA-domain-containing protein [Terfezia boudieri ATCC MYA-4762]
MSAITKTYLTGYSTLNALLWSVVLARTLTTLLTTFDPSAIYPSVGEFTRWAQTVIVLDFAHVLFGLVRTSLLTTLLQSFSRLFLVHAISPLSPTAHSSIFYTTMLVSWSVAEITRYTFYVYSAAGRAPRWLIWARYNFFFVLYVTGAGSEWACMWLSVRSGEVEEAGGKVVWGVVVGMLVAWPIFFPNQYLHMMALRRKMMRGKKKA